MYNVDDNYIKLYSCIYNNAPPLYSLSFTFFKLISSNSCILLWNKKKIILSGLVNTIIQNANMKNELRVIMNFIHQCDDYNKIKFLYFRFKRSVKNNRYKFQIFLDISSDNIKDLNKTFIKTDEQHIINFAKIITDLYIKKYRSIPHIKTTIDMNEYKSSNKIISTLQSNQLKSLYWLINSSYSQIQNFDIENIYLNNIIKISDNEFLKKNKDIGLDWICKGGIFIDNIEDGKILTFLSLLTINTTYKSLILCNKNNYKNWKDEILNYGIDITYKESTNNHNINNYSDFLVENPDIVREHKNIILCSYDDIFINKLNSIQWDCIIFDNYNEIIVNKEIVEYLSSLNSKMRWCITSMLCLENNDIYFNTLSILSIDGMINRIDNRRNFINNCVRANTKKISSKNIHYTTSILQFNQTERQLYNSILLKNNKINDNISEIDIIKYIRRIDSNYIDFLDNNIKKNIFLSNSILEIKKKNQNIKNSPICPVCPVCPICCDNIHNFMILLKCGHIFCVSCTILMIDYKYNNCSICRQNIASKNENIYYVLCNYNLVPIGTRILHTLNIIQNSVGKVIICVKSQKIISKLIKILNSNGICSVTIGNWLSKITEKLKFNNNPDVKVLITTYSIINGSMFDNITNIIFMQPNIDSNNPIKDEKSILNIGDRNDIILTRLIMKDTPEESYYKNINNYFLT
jgi:hypothetical protein